MINTVKGTDTLSKFLRQKKEEASAVDIDWNAKKDDWITSVNQLYNFLTDTLLKQSIDEKLVEVHKAPKQITEEYRRIHASRTSFEDWKYKCRLFA